MSACERLKAKERIRGSLESYEKAVVEGLNRTANVIIGT